MLRTHGNELEYVFRSTIDKMCVAPKNSKISRHEERLTSLNTNKLAIHMILRSVGVPMIMPTTMLVVVRVMAVVVVKFRAVVHLIRFHIVTPF